ncbi:heterokaryon incompatibility protein-domain-containing protein, partial [Phaeosphaeriaceae sp. PMI808]
MPPSSSLQYQPLDSDTRQKPIRLLELLPSRTAATIQCRLIHTFLIDQPFYEALSYCWGDESNQVTIQCDTRAITVTQNLYAALVRLRKKQKIRTLWVDAICINQKDNSERTQQVRQMTDVYRYADQTLVWLGPGNGQTKKAFQLVPYLLNAHMAFDGGQPFFFSPHLKRRLTHPAFGALQNQRHLYGAFRQLDRLPYFSRLWIVQELAISGGKTQFFCG